MEGVGCKLIIKVIQHAAMSTGPSVCGCRLVCYGGLSFIARHFVHCRRKSALSYGNFGYRFYLWWSIDLYILLLFV